MVSIILCGFEPSKMRYVETPNYVLISESRPAERTEGRNTYPLSASTLTIGVALHSSVPLRYCVLRFQVLESYAINC